MYPAWRDSDEVDARETYDRSDRDIVSGTPVFVGIRVPFQTLLDHLSAGQPVSEFFDSSPLLRRSGPSPRWKARGVASDP